MQKIKYWYNGYRFSDAEVKVYNPFSTLSFFNEAAFRNFWFDTGTPTYLSELIKLRDSSVESYEDSISLSESLLENYDIDNVPLVPILYDTGYLTIKDFNVRNDITKYALSYPNFEVKSSFIENLLKI